MKLEAGLPTSMATTHGDSRPQQPVTPILHSSPGMVDWLQAQGGSLVFTTYQNSRIFFVSALGMAIVRDKLFVTNFAIN